MTDESATTAALLARTAADADLDGGAISLDEAVQQLGKSERTIRRLIKAGKIDAYKINTPRGQVWRVYAEPRDSKPGTSGGSVSTTAANSATMAADAGSPELMKALEMVSSLTQRNEQLAGQVGFLQAKLQDAEKTIALLQAPKEVESEDATAEEKPENRRPWWRFWGK